MAPFCSAVIGTMALLGAATIGGCAVETHCFDPLEVHHYEGKVTITLPDGRSFPGGDVLASRSIWRDEIYERVTTLGTPPGGEAREFEVSMKVEGSTLTMKERSGAFIGTGTLTGPTGAWTAWRTESVLPDGTKVVSEDVLTGGGLRAAKEIRGADGVLRATTVEEFREVSLDTYWIARRRMLKLPLPPTRE